MVRATAGDCVGSEASSLTLRSILAPRTPPALLIWSTASCMPFLVWTPATIPAPVTERSAPSLMVLPEYELVALPPPPLVLQATTMTAATNAETRRSRFTSTVFHVPKPHAWSRLNNWGTSGLGCGYCGSIPFSVSIRILDTAQFRWFLSLAATTYH